MNYLYVIIFFGFIVTLIASYYLYNYFFGLNYTNILCGSKEFRGNFNTFISNTKLPMSKTRSSYSYTMALKIPNLPENSEWKTNVNYQKPILYRFGSPNINYDVMNHKLIIQVAYKDKLNMINYHDITLDSLPNQKSIFLGIVVDNLNVDIYINGKRYLSSKMPHVPFIFNRNVYLGDKDNNFNGKVGDIKYFNIALNEEQIQDIHKNTMII